MNDLQILRDAWGEPAPPSPAARARARARLTRRRRPLAPRIAALATAAAVAAGFAVVVADLGDAPPGVPVASAEVLERAAAAAERRPFTPPRPDQWIYVEDRITSTDGAPQIRRRWHGVSGGGLAIIDERGRLRVIDMMPSKRHDRRRPPDPFAYPSLARLPADPDALLRWAYRQAEHVTGAGLTENGDVYAIFNLALGDNVLPPKLEAAIFRAMKRVPGVTVRTIDLRGRPVLALGQTEDWLREELLLDPRTYAYRGKRSTVVHDAVIDPAKAGNATGRIERGHRVLDERLRTAIVNEPGQRR
jgi:hypothetical protein